MPAFQNETCSSTQAQDNQYTCHITPYLLHLWSIHLVKMAFYSGKVSLPTQEAHCSVEWCDSHWLPNIFEVSLLFLSLISLSCIQNQLETELGEGRGRESTNDDIYRKSRSTKEDRDEDIKQEASHQDQQCRPQRMKTDLTTQACTQITKTWVSAYQKGSQ